MALLTPQAALDRDQARRIAAIFSTLVHSEKVSHGKGNLDSLDKKIYAYPTHG